MSNSPPSDPFLSYASQKGAAIAPAAPASPSAPAAPSATAEDPFLSYASQKGATVAPASPDTPPTAAAAPEAPYATVQRLQPKIDAGSASPDERNEWLAARTTDLHQTTLPQRIARTIADAPYGKILPAVGGWLAHTAGNVENTGIKAASALVNPSTENLEAAGKAAVSVPIGAVAEGGEIGKGLVKGIGNAEITAGMAALNPFHPNSDWAPRVQAQRELDLADLASKIQPEAVKALAPDQAAAGTGAAAVDVASALAGPKGVGAAPDLMTAAAPERLMGMSAAKSIKAAQTVADGAPAGALSAVSQYAAEAIKAGAEAAAEKAHPIMSTAVKAVKGVLSATGTTAKAVAPVAGRTAAGGVVGGALGAEAASPGEEPEALASGVASGMLAGAARSPKALAAVNGVEAPPVRSFSLAARAPEPPEITSVQAPRTLALPENAPAGTPPGPSAAGAGSVDTALAAQSTARPPLKLSTVPPAAQPVSRFAGGPEAVGGLIDTAKEGNATLRSQILTGDKEPPPALVKDQADLSDKPLATVGPVPEGTNSPAQKTSQNLGNELVKQPGFDTVMNTLFGGNRGGKGTPTTQFRIHDMADGSTFDVAGLKAQVIRPPGVEDSTVVRFSDPNIPDVAIYKPIEGKYAFPTDTGPQEIARLDKDNPTPITIKGEPHQVLASRGKTDPVTLANAAGQKKVIASRTLLNADSPSVPPATIPVPMKAIAGSSNLESYGYDANTQTLYVKPKGTNNVYAHQGVGIDVAKAMDEAESKGKFYSSEVKKKFPFQ